MQKLLNLYKGWKGEEPAHVSKMSGGGSNRTYIRMTDADGQTVVGVIGTSRDENHAFVRLSNHFCQCSLPVPSVLAVSDDEMRYLQTDLGALSLYDFLHSGRESGGCYSEREKQMVRSAIRSLARLQILGARGLDFSVCYPQAEFDIDSVRFDLNYFKYCFLKATGIDFNEQKLESDFRLLAEDLTIDDDSPLSGVSSFLYRDFQARNIMLVPKTEENSLSDCCNIQEQLPYEPFFIDFQGGRRGPVYYDLASFLWQASAKYPDEMRSEMVDEYRLQLQRYVDVPPRQQFVKRLSLFVLFRTLQVLGAYGFRGYFEHKRYFLDSIPLAIQNLRDLLLPPKIRGGKSFLSGIPSRYPYLKSVLQQLTELPRFQPQAALPQAAPSRYDGKGPLVVRVFSFSYRKGIPEDESGNGGGYVFDCRSTHNPGRYEPYKQLTGLDQPVIRFLEEDGEILTFLDSIYKLADAHVERYIERGFTSLMFSFGCTGGQHRSVYSAQHLAEHIHGKYGVEVRICHREQHITQVLR